MNRSTSIVRVARGAPGAASVPGSALPAALPESERHHFGSLLQHDFSQVRIHTGLPAAAAAAAHGAKAFTDGDDIAFAAGRYQPGTAAGRALLAHELVHVAQQSRGGSASGAEARAQQAGAKAAHGEPAGVSEQGGAGQGVQCEDDPDKERLRQPYAPSFGALTLSMPTVGSSLAPALPAPSLVPPLTLSTPGLTGTPGLGGYQPYTLPTPALLSPYGPPAPPAVTPLPVLTPPQPPFAAMQNAELLAPFAHHGTSPSAMRISIHSDWASAYTMFRSYMPEGMAVFSANLFLSSAYQSMLERDAPNALDIQNRRFKEAYPDAGGIPPLPVLSSSSLTTAYEYLTGKKNTFKFYF